MSTREQWRAAELRMRRAKDAFTQAAVASLYGDSDASDRARAALEELNAARIALADAQPVSGHVVRRSAEA